MEKTLQHKLELFVANTQTIRKEFVWQHSLTKRLAALLYAQEGKPLDCEALRRCHGLIKEGVGPFSAFRGDMALCVATLLSLSPNPQGLFDRTLQVYALLKEEKLWASEHLTIAAFQIAAQSDPAEHAAIAARTRAFYDGMKANHFFLTGQDDYVFAAMLGLSGMDVAAGTARIEAFHRRLKGEFLNNNSVQALSQVLVLGNADDALADRVLALRDAMRAQGIKLDKTYTLPALGCLALLPIEVADIVQDIAEAQAYLREQKGFGGLSLSTQELLLLASSMVAGEHAQTLKGGVLTSALTTSITNIRLAQQAAMIAVVASSAAATSAQS
jgi:hypothetical protein